MTFRERIGRWFCLAGGFLIGVGVAIAGWDAAKFMSMVANHTQTIGGGR